MPLSALLFEIASFGGAWGERHSGIRSLTLKRFSARTRASTGNTDPIERGIATPARLLYPLIPGFYPLIPGAAIVSMDRRRMFSRPEMRHRVESICPLFIHLFK